MRKNQKKNRNRRNKRKEERTDDGRGKTDWNRRNLEKMRKKRGGECKEFEKK